MANYGRGWGDGYGSQSPESIEAHVEQDHLEYERNRDQAERYRRQKEAPMTDKTLAERPRSIPEYWVDMKLGKEAADALDAKDARIAELEAALDSHHAEVGSNIWRWWSDKARFFAQRNTMLYGDLNAKDAEIAGLREALGPFDHAIRSARTRLDDRCDLADIEAVALRFIRLDDLKNAAAALRK